MNAYKHIISGYLAAVMGMVLLLAVGKVALAHDLDGIWGSTQYKVELNVSGTTVKGLFSSLWHPDQPLGSIAGQLKNNTFFADWQMPAGEGSGDFSSVLTLLPDGETLSGFIWIQGLYSTSFALHRVVDGEIPVIF
ncbi:MAG: hypothetical protein U5L00_18915 [Desulfovermiculus sp.]|nr:hypothetical protein [Desulfovermiculus sp.]